MKNNNKIKTTGKFVVPEGWDPKAKKLPFESLPLVDISDLDHLNFKDYLEKLKEEGQNVDGCKSVAVSLFEVAKDFEDKQPLGLSIKKLQNDLLIQKKAQAQQLEANRRTGLGRAITPELIVLASKPKVGKQQKIMFLPGTFKNAPWNKAYHAVRQFLNEKKYITYFRLCIAWYYQKSKPGSFISRNRRYGLGDVDITKKFLQRVHD